LKVLMRSHQAKGIDLWGRAANGDDTALERQVLHGVQQTPH
jgi:hypothetical protein